MYYVWRRSDGYVNSTTYNPSRMSYPNHTFEILLETQDWPEAYYLIESERAKEK